MIKKFLALTLSMVLAIGILGLSNVPMKAQNFPGAQGNPSTLSRVSGTYYAPAFAWQGRIISGNAVTGSTSIIFIASTGGMGGPTLPDGSVLSFQTVFNTLTPMTVDWGQTAQETVTPTAVSVGTCPAGNLGVGGVAQCVTFTATFANTHGQSGVVMEGTYGLQSAINSAQQNGGGKVVVDYTWGQMGGTNAMLNAAVPFELVTIEDARGPDTQYWRPTQGVSTALATPATLTGQAACDATHFFCSDATAVGTWAAVAYYGCISYVDIMGNEGTCSATNNFTAVVSKAIDVGFATAKQGPAASTGAVGYTIYIGTSYAAAVQVPITSSICKMTTLETVTPACAVTNATYNQIGSDAQVAAITVTTSPLALLATTTSSTTDYIGNPNAVTVYKYAPSHRVGLNGILGSSWGFAVGAAAATTVPNVIGTLAIPPGFMNFAGRSIEICGNATEASTGSTSTITTMQLWWDAAGSDTATGVPILVGTIAMTNTLVTAKTDQYYFCMDLRTTVAGAGVTAGTIQQDGGFFCEQYTSSSVATVPVCVLAQGPAAVGSLNLAGTLGFTTRIHVVYLHTTGTDGAGVQLTNLTVKELN